MFALRQWLWRWSLHRPASLAMGFLIPMVFATGTLAAGKSAVLIVDANSGRTLHQSAADEPRYPASLAKMMTLYLVFELIEQGRLTYQTKIKISANAAGAAPSKLDLDPGDEISLLDAVKVLITKSANDIAIAVAEHVAGSEEQFARLMTRRARELGMSGTLFRNASGLPDPEQVTTARDMVTLALHLQDNFPRHYPLFATRTFTYKDDTFRNHNTLLFHYEGTDGLKTGYTRASGFNLVTSVRRGRKHLIGVVFGGASAASRNTAMRTFLNMGLVKASSEKTRQPVVVARARPEPEHSKVATVPTPRRVERPPLKPASEVRGTTPEAVAEQPAGYPVQIARVRPVLVGTSTPEAKPLPVSGDPDPPTTIEAVLEQWRGANPDRQDQAPVGRTTMPAFAAASTSAMRLLAAPPAPETPALMREPTPASGAAPSTFEQQAANLAQGEAASPATVHSVPPATRPQRVAAQAAIGYQIQIGAFQSATEAERQLAAVRARAAALLGSAAAVTQQIKQGDKVLYRARYAGFEAQPAAATACTELKRLKIECLVVKAE